MWRWFRSTNESVAPVTTETIDSATAGNITGMVVLEGQPPAPENIRMNSDPACLQEAGNSTETEYYLVDADGGLNNVFVYVKEGLEGWIVPPSPLTPSRSTRMPAATNPRFRDSGRSDARDLEQR